MRDSCGRQLQEIDKETDRARERERERQIEGERQRQSGRKIERL